MSITMKAALFTGVSALVTVLAPAASAQGPAEGSQSEAGARGVTQSGIADIIVTARRRSESLLETPVAVTAFTAEDLEERHITQLTELQKSTPSLIFEATGGTNSEARVFVRGVGNNVGNANFSAGVGIYIDGAFFGRVQGALLDSLDMATIEVLRGPQGTLFGKNTIGGAVNITTVRPNTDEFFGSLEAGYGRFDHVRVRASVNVPLVKDKLAVRLSGMSDRDDGYSVNDVNGQRLDNTNRRAIAGSLRFTPTENVTLDINSFYSRDRTNGRAIGCFVTGESPLGQAFLDACVASNANGIRHTRSDIIQTYPTDMFAISGQLAWNLGEVGAIDDLTVKVIGAHQRINTSNTKQEFDGTDIDGIWGNQQHYIQGQTSGELQLLGEAFDRKLNFVLGAYADREFAIGGPLTQHAHIFPQFEAFGVPLSYVLQISPKSWSRAAYAQFTYDFNKVVSVTGGIRYTKDRAGSRALKYNQFEADPNNVVIVQPFLTDNIFLKKNSNWTPMGSLQLNAPESWTSGGFLDQGMLYFTYSKGYKAGGFNAGGNEISGGVTSFEPEQVDNYEVGVKFAMFNRRLVGSISRYQMDYKNIQFSVANPTEDFGIVLATFNAGAAKVKGIEVELQALLLDSLRLSFSGDFNSAHYTRFDDASVPGGSRVGEPFAIIPDYRVSGSIENRFPLGGDMALTPRFQVTRTGKRLFWQDPSPVIQAVATSGPVTVADASLRLDVNEQLSFDVFGKNIFNKKYFNDSQTLGFITFRYYAAPVTWGVVARVKF
jgi:iron complex outermembrane receptor protein